MRDPDRIVRYTTAGTPVRVKDEPVGLTGFGRLVLAAGPDLRDPHDPKPRPVKRPARPARRYRPAHEVKADLDRAQARADDLTARVEKQRDSGARMMSAESYAAMYDRAAAARMKAARLRRTYENALEREKTT